jgi:hypothetical protein
MHRTSYSASAYLQVQYERAMVESPMKAFDIMKEIQVGACLIPTNCSSVDEEA